MIEYRGKRLAVLCECTVETPSAKLSALKDRASALAEYLQNEAEIAPVLFTSADPVESDYKQAAEHKISLIGEPQIAGLVELLGQDVEPQIVIERLRQVVSSFTYANWKR